MVSVAALCLVGAVAYLPDLVAASTSSSTPATAPTATVTLVGHGLGDGEGMGQWGALGYALGGYGFAEILGHFYGGTTMATVSNQSIRVVITENDGNDTVVTSASPFTVAGHAFNPGQAAKMALTAAGSFTLTKGSGCTATTWTAVATLSAAGAVAIPSVTPTTTTTTAATADDSLELCQPGASQAYRGDIEAVSEQGAVRTLNVLPLESYLLGVVGSESPSGWGSLGKAGPQGEPEGFQELEAQAVAARSYVMSGLDQYGYADICDTSACQEYKGVAGESPLVDLAVADTAGKVLESSPGHVATTYYSASTGGYTSGGAFPAVVDAGDSVCVPSACNPDHDWSAQVPVSTIDADWPAIGTLSGIQVTKRNGLGAYGGRVEDLTLTGSEGETTVTGDAFASALGLDSNWFSVASQPVPPPPPPLHLVGDRVLDAAGDVLDAGSAAYYGSLTGYSLTTPLTGFAGMPDGDGYWLLGTGGQVSAFGGAEVYGSADSLGLGQSFVDIASAPGGKGYWLVTGAGGVYTYGDATFHGAAAPEHPSQPIVAIASTPDGKGYWLVSSGGQVYAFGDAHGYGSAVSLELPLPIVGIAATPSGKGYWLLESNGGVFSFGDAAYSGSLPSLKLKNPVGRATTLVPTPDGGGYLIGTTSGLVYHFGDAQSLGPPLAPTTFHAPAVGLVGVDASSG